MTLPNFLIIGAAKSGTTALYHHLSQHPQIYMCPVKEPNFFALEGEKPDFRGPSDLEIMRRSNSVSLTTDIEAYRALFRGVSDETAIGEASTWYLYVPKAPERIQQHIPNAKLIVILRNPVERAYSSFLHLVRGGREPLTDFAQALREEETRIYDNWEPLWHYKQMGFYYVQLRRYYDSFDREQIGVYLYEDFENDPVGVLKDIFRLLNVNEAFVPDVSSRHGMSGVPRNKAVRAMNKFLIKSHPTKSVLKPVLPEELRRRVVTRMVNILRNRYLTKPQLSPNLRSELTAAYREDVVRLQGLIRRDLSEWLK